MTEEIGVVDFVVLDNRITVVTEHRGFDIRFRHRGCIGIDGVVEPLSTELFRPSEKDLAEIAMKVAEQFIDQQTPYEMYDGTHWDHTKTLRGLKYGLREEFAKLDGDELTTLAERLQRDEITFEDDD